MSRNLVEVKGASTRLLERHLGYWSAAGVTGRADRLKELLTSFESVRPYGINVYLLFSKIRHTCYSPLPNIDIIFI